MKCTGMREGWRMVTLARALGMKVMVGCMTETSCACSAAASFLLRLTLLIWMAICLCQRPLQGNGGRKGQDHVTRFAWHRVVKL